MDPMQMLDMIIKYGAVPVLCIISWKLWKKTETQDHQIAKLNEDHKTDIKVSSEESKGMQQNMLNTINEFTVKMDEIRSELKDLKK